MEIFKIGNWLINQDGIKWDGNPKIEYVIHKDRLTETDMQDENIYEWLVHMPKKTWLTREDIYALNTAFLYALEKFDIPFPANFSFVETFIEQDKQMKGK